jgi:hypothetical protein
MPLSSAFEVEGGKFLGGLFGVLKNEVTSSGTPILRLMMDFRPINENFLNLGVTCALCQSSHSFFNWKCAHMKKSLFLRF